MTGRPYDRYARDRYRRANPGDGPTAAQRSYLKSLREKCGEESYNEALCAVFGVRWSGPSSLTAERVPNTPSTVTRAQLSQVISLLAEPEAK